MLNFSLVMGTAKGSFHQFGQDCSIGQKTGSRLNFPYYRIFQFLKDHSVPLLALQGFLCIAFFRNLW